MRRVINATKLDFYLIVSVLTISIILLVVAFGIGALTKQPSVTVALVMVFAVFIGGNVFGNQEAGHIDVLYALLPIRKLELVVGRFLYGLLMGLAGAVVGSVLYVVSSLIFGYPMDGALFVGVLCVAFVYYCFATAVSYPIYFRFGFARAYVLTMLPMYLIVLLGALIVRKTTNFAKTMNDILTWFRDNQALIPVLAVVVGLVLLVIGAAVSYVIYRHQESSLSGSGRPLTRFGIG